MILGYIAGNGKEMPSIQNKKVDAYCKKIVEICSQTDDECIELFNRSIAVLDTIGLKESRDEIRSLADTQSISDYCVKNIIMA